MPPLTSSLLKTARYLGAGLLLMAAVNQQALAKELAAGIWTYHFAVTQACRITLSQNGAVTLDENINDIKPGTPATLKTVDIYASGCAGGENNDVMLTLQGKQDAKDPTLFELTDDTGVPIHGVGLYIAHDITGNLQVIPPDPTGKATVISDEFQQHGQGGATSPPEALVRLQLGYARDSGTPPTGANVNTTITITAQPH